MITKFQYTHVKTTLKIYNSSFVNNKAACVGSSVYLGVAVYIVIKQTQFVNHFNSSSDTIWFSYSDNFTTDQVSFEAQEDSTQGGELFVATAAFFPNRFLGFKCPISSTILFSDSSDGLFSNKNVKCQYCPNGTYTSTPSSMSGFNASTNKQRQCQSCSFGAVCQRGIKPKPNFWGYVHKRRALMIVCPPGYCCQTADQCISLNSCNGNRAGRLCGKCKHGYFQSVFTSDCLEEKVCKTGKFWALAITTCFLFTVMFTFLQDTFSFIVKILNMDSLPLLIRRRVEWLGKALILERTDDFQLDHRSENESSSNRDSDEVERYDELEIDKEGNILKNNTSTAAGLIKIVFFFYQIHSVLTVHKSHREIQYLKALKSLALSIFNLNVQVSLNREFHCPFHGMRSTTKVWITGIFPVMCLVFAGFFYTCSYSLSQFFSRNDSIQRYSIKAKPRLLTAILQLTLLGYSTLISNILSLVSCISLVNGDRILYIDGNVPCYQMWQYAILMFIALWAIPLIYALYQLPSYMRREEISLQGVYIALLLPLPFAVYAMVRGVKKMKYTTSDDSFNNRYQTHSIPYIRMKQKDVAILQLLNVIEGPFRYKKSEEKGEKLSWESILLLQRILLSLCHTFVLQPDMRSLLLLLFMIIFLYMNAHYRPFDSGFLNAMNGIALILLCITGMINIVYAFSYKYGSVPNGPLVQLLAIYDYLEVLMIMIFPMIAGIILTTLLLVKFTGFIVHIVGFFIPKCKRCESKGY